MKKCICGGEPRLTTDGVYSFSWECSMCPASTPEMPMEIDAKWVWEAMMEEAENQMEDYDDEKDDD